MNPINQSSQTWLTVNQAINREDYAWLIDFAHFRENCPTGLIPEWMQKVTEHDGIMQYNSIDVDILIFVSTPINPRFVVSRSYPLSIKNSYHRLWTRYSHYSNIIIVIEKKFKRLKFLLRLWLTVYCWMLVHSTLYCMKTRLSTSCVTVNYHWSIAEFPTSQRSHQINNEFRLWRVPRMVAFNQSIKQYNRYNRSIDHWINQAING